MKRLVEIIEWLILFAIVTTLLAVLSSEMVVSERNLKDKYQSLEREYYNHE